MSNNSTIKCPQCKYEFEATDAFRDEVQRDLNLKAKEWQNNKEEEYRKKEDAFQQQLADSLNKQKHNIEVTLRKSISGDFESKLKILNDANIENEEKLKLSRLNELEFLKKEQILKTKEAELEITLQKKLNEAQNSITETVKKQEQEKNNLRFKEYEKKISDNLELIEIMKNKSELGSMQLQGEVQEIALEELLRNTFQFDVIEEVAKGVKGADCILHVKNNLAQPCGKIIFESKRTKSFTNEWIEKLKNDMRAQQSDIGIIVTETLPRDMNTFGFKDGVWICRFNEVKPLSYILRDSLIKINTALVTQENKADKMHVLYNYLTGIEFRQNIEAVVEGFLSLKDGITREKIQMEKIWKEREKQLEKVLNNTIQFYGSIKGIAGNAIGDLKILE